jgi:ABC-type polar amino acid transport system ATPase subunit
MQINDSGVIFVFQSFSTFIKVTAVDEITGTEVHISCPKNLTQAEMKKNALQKLAYVLKRNNQND